jgi:hypothetical protein
VLIDGPSMLRMLPNATIVQTPIYDQHIIGNNGISLNNNMLYAQQGQTSQYSAYPSQVGQGGMHVGPSMLPMIIPQQGGYTQLPYSQQMNVNGDYLSPGTNNFNNISNADINVAAVMSGTSTPGWISNIPN